MNITIEELKKSKSFCILPWIHSRINQDGNVYPCCKMSSFYLYGSVYKNDLSEILNDEPVKKLRKQMLAEEAVSFCSDCISHEKKNYLSYRNVMNEKFSHCFTDVLNTTADGSVPDIKLKYLDIRLSNTCNMSCRSCGPQNSTGWYSDAKKIDSFFVNDLLRLEESSEDVFGKLDDQLEKIESIYFAGGEPLVEKMHYEILAKLISKGKTNINLLYNSNFSNFNFGTIDVVTLWRQFNRVGIGMSLDGVGAHFELLRKGGQWEKIVNNFKRLKSELNNVDLYVNPTISVLNSFHITEAIEKFIEIGMVSKSNDLILDIASEPEYINMNILNEKERDLLKSHYDTFLSKLRKNKRIDYALTDHIENELGKVLSSISTTFNPEGRKRFKHYTIRLDSLRSERTIILFPELFELIME
jgi:MoaA/NifB/PqqE/SkfB family radical SAM enzyme